MNYIKYKIKNTIYDRYNHCLIKSTANDCSDNFDNNVVVLHHGKMTRSVDTNDSYSSTTPLIHVYAGKYAVLSENGDELHYITGAATINKLYNIIYKRYSKKLFTHISNWDRFRCDPYIKLILLVLRQQIRLPKCIKYDILVNVLHMNPRSKMSINNAN